RRGRRRSGPPAPSAAAGRADPRPSRSAFDFGLYDLERLGVEVDLDLLAVLVAAVDLVAVPVDLELVDLVALRHQLGAGERGSRQQHAGETGGDDGEANHRRVLPVGTLPLRMIRNALSMQLRRNHRSRRRFSRIFFQYSNRLRISRSKPRSTGW